MKNKIVALVLFLSIAMTPTLAMAQTQVSIDQQRTILVQLISLYQQLIALLIQNGQISQSDAQTLTLSPDLSQPEPIETNTSNSEPQVSAVPTVPVVSLNSVENPKYTENRTQRFGIYSFNIQNVTADPISISALNLSVIINTDTIQPTPIFYLSMQPNSFPSNELTKMTAWSKSNQAITYTFSKPIIIQPDVTNVFIFDVLLNSLNTGDTVSTSLTDDSLGDSLDAINLTVK